MKIGIIGAGNIAGTMATTLQQLKGTECYAIASRDIKRARAFADKYGFEKAYGSYADMLSDPYVELVYIATPHSHHYEHIRMSLNHGKHVLCEKAFCANAKQAEEVLRLARERGLLLAEAMWTRYMPMRGLINKVLKSGIIGNPTSLSANLGYPLINKSRLVRPELAGGALLDLGVYVLNFASMVFGDSIDSIAANCVKLDSGVDAQENIMLTYRDGRMASLYVTMLAQTDRRGLINGTNGYIEIENINNYEMVRVFNLERKIVAEYTAPTQITGYEYEVQSVMRAIRDGKLECPEMPHTEIIRMMQLMDSIRNAWNIEFPFERDNTIRITADEIPDTGVYEAQEQEKPSKSVVRKISEKAVSDTEYENTVKPKAKNAKDARDKLPPSPHRGITDKLPKNLEFASESYAPKKLKEPTVLKKPEIPEPALEESNEEVKKPLEDTSEDIMAKLPIPEDEPKKRTEQERALDQIKEHIEQIEREDQAIRAEIQKAIPDDMDLDEEDDVHDSASVEQAAEVIREISAESRKKRKSPTEQLFDLGAELAVHEYKGVGSITDQLRDIVIEEKPAPDSRTVTGKIRDLDVPDHDENSGFQRKREPGVRSLNNYN